MKTRVHFLKVKVIAPHKLPPTQVRELLDDVIRVGKAALQLQIADDDDAVSLLNNLPERPELQQLQIFKAKRC